MKQPRGIRNHNPGNVEYDGTPWQGLDSPPSDGRFCRCIAAVYGIRMIARILITYQDERKAADGSKIDTVREIIERWAPPSDKNNTLAYAAHVRQVLGLDLGETLDVHDYAVMRPLVEAIILHENGVMPYTAAQIDKGLVLAGIEPPQKSLQQSRTVKGGQVAAVGTVGTALSDAAQQLAPLADYSDLIKWLFLALTLAGIGYAVWARIDDRNRGLR